MEIHEDLMSWAHPWRGGPVPADLAPRTVPAKHTVLKDFEAALAAPDSEPAYVAAVRADEPSPMRAAALQALAEAAAAKKLPVASFVDAWVAEHGHAFAAAAVMERLEMQAHAPARGSKPTRIRRVAEPFRHRTDRFLAGRLRELLTAADDTAYAETVAAVAPYRGRGPQHMIAAAYLLPAETDWVGESLSGWIGDEGLRLWQWASVLTEPDLALAREALGRPVLDRGALSTLFVALGHRTVPLIGDALEESRRWGWEREEAYAVLGRVRTDEAFTLLLGQFDAGNARPAVAAAARLDPGRAARLLPMVARGDEHPADVGRDLLRAHLNAHPDLDVPDEVRELAGVVPRMPETGPVPALELPAKPAAAPWLHIAELPQIRLRDSGTAWSREVAAGLVALLAASEKAPHPELVRLRELSDRASLALFGRELFEAWRRADEPSEQGWVLKAQAWIGDGETVRRLVPPIDGSWPRLNFHRAAAGLWVLAEMDTEDALRALHRLSLRGSSKGVRGRAEGMVEQVARRLGLDGEQLADRLVPRFEERVFDYGPRRFVLGFDESLSPFVTDEAGRVRKSLPAPNAKDDADLAAVARKRLTALKKELRAVASDQLHRLERAMVLQRSWTAAEFTERLAGHPLMVHLVRRLVWTTGTAEFRVAEDGTLAGVTDALFVLPPDASVAIAHPVLIPATLDAWGEIFADYAILQPFRQLGRPVAALTAEERAGTELPRFTGTTTTTGALLGLTRTGWERCRPEDGGWEPRLLRRLPDRHVLEMELDPGIPVGRTEGAQTQVVRSVGLRGPRPLGEVLDAVTASEVLTGLAGLS
ncbi:DUF4132 domain-containing protein [Actinocorallia longicatena]|uniref:DUF4132 domain-containing protein n=1 Tax=Actinocorallia longicatena TaxID=111803 RepID=A0ABP6PX30_9ACTN